MMMPGWIGLVDPEHAEHDDEAHEPAIGDARQRELAVVRVERPAPVLHGISAAGWRERAAATTYPSWECDCKTLIGSHYWQEFPDRSRTLMVQPVKGEAYPCPTWRPVMAVPDLRSKAQKRAEAKRPVPAGEALALAPAGPVAPLEVVPDFVPVRDYPVGARALVPLARRITRAVGRPVPGAEPVTSLRLVGSHIGVPWWAVWESEKGKSPTFTVGFVGGEKVNLGELKYRLGIGPMPVKRTRTAPAGAAPKPAKRTTTRVFVGD